MMKILYICYENDVKTTKRNNVMKNVEIPSKQIQQKNSIQVHKIVSKSMKKYKSQ